MKKLGRPRKAHALRKENISVNLPKSLVSQIESKLSYGSSRSTWVQKAIENRLADDKQGIKPKYYKDIDTIPLLALVRDRPDIDDNVKFVIKMYLDKYYDELDLKLKMQAEEIEAER